MLNEKPEILLRFSQIISKENSGIDNKIVTNTENATIQNKVNVKYSLSRMV